MSRTIDFNNLGGFPATQYTLDYMQTAYREAITGLAQIAGTNVIVTGVKNENGIVSDGWIVWEGELLPFKGGLLQDTFIIDEITESRRYNDEVIRTPYKFRHARFASGGNDFSGLIRLSSFLSLQGVVSTLEGKLEQLDNALRPNIVPPGVIMAWPFDVSDIPTGWALCDGQEGRPHIQGRFLVGAGQALGLFPGDLNPAYSVSEIGGENKHKLTIPEMPSHDHDADYPSSEKFSGNKFDAANANNAGKRKTSKSGGDLPHENRPPFYAVHWIIKL